MSVKPKFIRKLTLVTISACVLTIPATALSWGHFNNGALRGTFVIAIDGTFVSAPPPFTGGVLPFKASQVGRLVFDGAGLAKGEATLTFHHPDVPFGVISKFAFDGTYDVAANGHVVISLDEFPLDMNGEPMATRANSVVLECFIVRRNFQMRCVMHTLISYQQGPVPRSLPVTMSGSLQRQF